MQKCGIGLLADRRLHFYMANGVLSSYPKMKKLT